MFGYWEVREIAPGPEGTAQTLNVMAELVREAQLEAVTRETALHLMTIWRPGQTRTGIQRLTRWVRSHMRFINEPIETLHKPGWMLQTIGTQGWVWGDCDDAAMLTATLGVAVGLAARLVAIRPPNTTEFVHVFSELGKDGIWLASDPTSFHQAPSDWDRMTLEI